MAGDGYVLYHVLYKDEDEEDLEKDEILPLLQSAKEFANELAQEKQSAL